MVKMSFLIYELVTLTLKRTKQSFHTTFWLMMTNCSEDISETLSEILNFCSDLDLEKHNPIFSHETLAVNDVLSN